MGNEDYSRRNAWYPKPYSAYAHVSVTASGNNWSLKDNSGLFSKLTIASEIFIRNGDTDLEVKFNSADNDSIPIVGNSEFGQSGYNVQDLFVTCSGNAQLMVYAMGWK